MTSLPNGFTKNAADHHSPKGENVLLAVHRNSHSRVEFYWYIDFRWCRRIAPATILGTSKLRTTIIWNGTLATSAWAELRIDNDEVKVFSLAGSQMCGGRLKECSIKEIGGIETLIIGELPITWIHELPQEDLGILQKQIRLTEREP